MTITKALRKLYKVIVGEEAPANANTITKVLLALAEAWTGSGGGSGGSGGGAEPLIVSINGDDESGYALDRTWQEIHDAFPNVILRRVSSKGGEHESFYSVINVRDSGLYSGPGRTTYYVESLQSSTAGLTIYKTYDPNGYPGITDEGVN